MKTPHKHAAFIHAWADGAEIEVRIRNDDVWLKLTPHPAWDSTEYRIKPTPKPDVVSKFEIRSDGIVWRNTPNINIKLTFDGKSGDLKSAEVL